MKFKVTLIINGRIIFSTIYDFTGLKNVTVVNTVSNVQAMIDEMNRLYHPQYSDVQIELQNIG